MLTERKMDLGDVEIHYAEGPETGPPLVLLHGLPGYWQEFLPVLPALMLRWHVHALDLRGQGKSGRVSGGYKAANYVEDTVEFVQRKFATPVFLCGQSAGGVAALGAAVRMPDLVQGVIVGDGPLDREALIAWMTSEGFTAHFSVLREIAGVKNCSKSELVSLVADMPVQVPGQDNTIRYIDSPGMDAVRIQELAMVLADMDPDVLAYHATGRAVEFLEGFDMDQWLVEIRCPILLLQADPALGAMLSDKSVANVKSALPGTKHVLFEGYGHSLGLDIWNVGLWLRAVTNFMMLCG